MPKSPRMVWNIPKEDTDPWFEDFVDLIGQIDSSVYTTREDKNIVLTGGGVFSFNGGTGVLSWAASIELVAAITGFLWTIPAGNITLDDGAFLYVELVRAPADNITLTAKVGSQLVPGVRADDFLIIAVRRGNIIYFRNGKILKSGETRAVLQEDAGFGTTGQLIRTPITLATDSFTDQNAYELVASYPFNPNDYTISGTTTQISFQAVFSVTSGLLTGNVQLYNLTDASSVAVFASSDTTNTSFVEVVSLPNSNKMYEIRIKVAGGSPPNDKIILMWAGLVVDHVF